jgi:hypothetical protein
MRSAKSRRRRVGGFGRWLSDDRHDKVSWLGGAGPIDGEARVVYEAVVKADLSRYADVVQYVADSLYSEDYTRSGASADIGIFRPWYHELAREILYRLDGAAIAIERDPAAVGHGG